VDNDIELTGTTSGQRLRSQILVPLLVSLTVLAGVFILVLDWNLKRDFHHRAADKTFPADNLFQNELNKTADALAGLLRLLQGDQELRSALRAGDRQRLQERAEILFPALRDSHWISHWYFSDPDRKNILRVHEPGRFGDRIERFTTLEAARTGRVAQGVELGKFGTFTLRVVAPWFDQGRLIGFAELGTDAESILNDLSRLLNCRLLLLIDKKQLDRTEWEVGQRMLGNPSDWQRFDDWVFSGAAPDGYLQKVRESLTQQGIPDNGETRWFDLGEKTYLVQGLPLADAAHREVGRILIALDTTKDNAYYGRLKRVVLATLVLSGGLLFLVLFRVSGNAQRQLVDFQRLQLQTNRVLGQRVEHRTRELRRSEEKYRELVENANSVILRWDTQGRITFFNRYAQQFFGYPEAEILGQNVMGTIVPETESGTERHLSEMIDDIGQNPDRYVSNLNENMRRDGSRVWIAWANRAVRDEQGRVVEILSTGTDVTKNQQAEAELRLAASVFDTSIEGIMVTDAKGRILRVNRAFTSITGYTPEEVIGKNPNLLRSSRHVDEFYKQMWVCLEKNGTWQGEIWNRRHSGEVYPQWLTITSVKDQSGRPIRYVGVFDDITEKKLSEERIYHLAHYDVLTELPNRVLFQDRLDRAMVCTRRDKTHFAILSLDLDGFKPVNDTLGHPVGDLLLQQCARRLQSCVRESDTVARMGGDEFTVLLQGLHDSDEVMRVCAHVAGAILRALSLPFDLEGQEVFISASIGIASFPEDGALAEDLVRHVDTALYCAKEQGRNQFVFYKAHMNAAAEERVRLEGQLRRALENNEFELQYQACKDLHTGHITSVEALLRWRHPEQGLLYPDEFLTLAEETGLIVPIGDWVLRTAAKQAVAWGRCQDDPPLVAVNLSPIQLRHREQLIETVLEVLEETGLEPNRLGFEVSERTLMENEQEITESLVELGRKGVQVLIDDFGTGYSSLKKLRTLPVKTLKIDRSFVRELGNDQNDTSIAETIIGMACSLQLQVVAEGVETEEQLGLLRQRGCHAAQGFLIHRPESAAALEKRLSASTSDRSRSGFPQSPGSVGAVING
jgi:diguanylate cyclase (GGDEF)-like protein/PAS domain S-box-containing protein